jgi:hypothetical protein
MENPDRARSKSANFLTHDRRSSAGRYDLPGRKSSGMAAYPRVTVSPPL